jgi:hypothetical protein
MSPNQSRLNRIALLSGVVALACFCSCKQKTENDVSLKDTLVFVMAGQSNMAGRAAVEAQDTFSNPRILSLEGDGSFALKSEPNQLNQGGLAGLDCGKSFGADLLTKLPESTYVCLVQCSISSTLINEWLGDSLHVVHLYSNMLDRSRQAMRSGKLKGVLWFHGEGDADVLETAIDYGNQLRKLILKYRTDVGNDHLPFYIGRLAAWCNKPLKDTINNQIESVARSLNDVYIISTNGLPGKSDSLHFNSEGQRGLGLRYAAEVEKHP